MSTAAEGDANNPAPRVEAGAEVLDGSPRWARLAAGVERLAVRTPTLPPATATNSLLIYGDRLLVVEPACHRESEQAILADRIESLVAEGISVAGFALTHHHRDHIGGAVALSRRFQCPVFAHPETARRIPEVDIVAVDQTWRLALGVGREICALYSPGHAPGHLIFVERASGIAHAGDLVAGVGTILIDPEDDGDLDTYLESLRHVRDRCRPQRDLSRSPDLLPSPLREASSRSDGERESSGEGLGHDEQVEAPQGAGELTIATLVPAHGPILAEPARAIEQLLAHRQARTDAIRHALAAGPLREDELLGRVYADLTRSLWPLARRSLAAHLVSLTRTGELSNRNGVWSSHSP